MGFCLMLFGLIMLKYSKRVEALEYPFLPNISALKAKDFDKLQINTNYKRYQVNPKPSVDKFIQIGNYKIPDRTDELRSKI